MNIDFARCERVRVTAEGQSVIAFMDQRGPDCVELTLVDHDTGRAWYAKFASDSIPRLYFASQSAIFIARQLSIPGVADRVQIVRQAREQTIAQRRRRVLGREKARALFDAAISIHELEQEDDWPEAVLELVYGLNWRAGYPKLPDPAFETLLRHTTLLQHALTIRSA